MMLTVQTEDEIVIRLDLCRKYEEECVINSAFFFFFSIIFLI